MGYLTKDALQAATFPVAAELLGPGPAALTQLPGGASIRHYHRIAVGARSLLVMELGDDPLKSEEAAKGTVRRSCRSSNVQRYLARAGVAVPEVYRYDARLGLVYLEDLGDVTFESMVASAADDERRRWYRLAIDELVRLQRYAKENPDPSCVAFSRGFDYDLLKLELDHFREYGLEAQGYTLTPADREELERHFVGHRPSASSSAPRACSSTATTRAAT